MIDLEIPLGKRTLKYRLFEMLPATLSYGALILLIVLSIISPILAAIYVMLVIITLVVKAVGIAIHTIGGRSRLDKAQKVNWSERLADLENPDKSYEDLKSTKSKAFGALLHVDNLRLITADPELFPKPSALYNAVIIATYNEDYAVLAPTIQSVIDTSYDNKKIILTIAYEQRGGEAIKQTVNELKKEFGKHFLAFHLVEHPSDLPGEVIGKGGNITHAGRFLKQWLIDQKIDSKNVIVTTLDSDNRPHKTYFDYVTYEYIVNEDRKHLSYQPVSLFMNNIWDVPAPMRVIATGNSFWNIISSMRPHTLRNFASHSQPMDALEEMDFWSTRTIVEDGHQYWRSYFYFGGNYSVLPIYVPIYQDAVLSNTYGKTLKAQFVQLRRWAYGASDVPYVATRIFTHKRNVPLYGGIARFVRLLDGHVTLASVSLLVAFGGWVPLWINSDAARSIPAHQLPDVVSVIQQIAMIGLFITVFLSFKMLPPRPERYKRRRNVLMLAQWVLMPLTAIIYSAISALYSQGRLFTGRYLDKFDVTDKATHDSALVARKQSRKQKKSKQTD
ncbi:MAG TPA: glycosyltransferase family 2 protein [Candidatus Saccharibacteria bacterium]|nr:glycosyltransferase family 2 protein [Candidatus Saccharibacteria bacterium]HRQ06977.1 glycosyltransferase family 2 protein [Candidatus Saccharibacteria bacterium]